MWNVDVSWWGDQREFSSQVTWFNEVWQSFHCLCHIPIMKSGGLKAIKAPGRSVIYSICCSISVDHLILNSFILHVEGQVGRSGLYFTKCSGSYDIWPAKSRGKMGRKKKSSELHEASCYGSITQACNRLTFQTHTLAFRQPLVGQVFFTRKHTARGDQHMFCWHKFKIYCRCQKWLLDKVDY